MNEYTYKIEIHNKITDKKKCNSIKAVTLLFRSGTIYNTRKVSYFMKKTGRFYQEENQKNYGFVEKDRD